MTTQTATGQATQASSDLLPTFLECDGVMPLILERLNRPICETYPEKCQHVPEHKNLHTESSVTEYLATQLPRLQDLTKAKVLMTTYKAAQMAVMNAMMKLNDLDPYEASRTATNLLAQLNSLVERKGPQTQVNINQLIYENLPDEEARQAWMYLTQNQRPQNGLQEGRVIEGYTS